MNLSAQFKAFLLSQKKRPSEVTVKNYLADVSQFISWCEKNGSAFTPHLISHKTLQDYLTTKQLSSSSRERHLSSLRKFFTFLKDEKLITELPFPSAPQTTPNDPWSLQDFRSHLALNKASHPTVKNYLGDIKHFTSWIAKKHTSLGTQSISHSYFSLVTGEMLEEYKASLQEYGFSTPSINRKLSSLRRYIHWASEKGLAEAKKVTIANISKKKETVINEAEQVSTPQTVIDTTLPSPTSLTDPLGILNPVKTAISTSTDQTPSKNPPVSTQDEITPAFHSVMHEPQNPTYSRFAPLRLLQKIRHGIILALDVTIIAGTAYIIEHMDYMRWIASGKQIFTASAKNGLGHEGNENKNISLKIIAQIADGVSQIIAIAYPPAHSYRHDMAKHHKAFYHMRHTRPNWYKKYHDLPMVHYFHFAALIIIMSAIGFMGYRAFFDDTGTSQAALPTAPPRVLSFQGRLTDNFDNPIDSATSLRFAIYNNLSASGAAMLWQEVQTTTPDQDGIFSVLLGSSTSIPDSVFRENSALYLGITVGTDSELQPRQQIATVAFAANSESLQGLLPITAAGAGTSNVVLALDSTGNLTIGGSATPTFEASGGQFTLSGNVLNLTTSSGTNSNVQLNPDGTGTVDVMKPLQNSTLNNNIPSAAGAVEVNDMFAVLATSSGQSAFTLNQNGAGPILSASSSGIARFTISNNGTGYFAGNVGIGSTAPAYKLDVQGGSGIVGRFSGRVIGASAVNNNEFVTLSQLNTSVGGSTFWQLNSNALSPINSTYDVLVGGTATSSALIKLGGTSGASSFFNTGGNVGIGTTTPGSIVDIYSASPTLTFRNSGGPNLADTGVILFSETVAPAGIKLRYDGSTGTGGGTFKITDITSGINTDLLSVMRNGNVGIGTTSPAQLFAVGSGSPFHVNTAGYAKAPALALGTGTLGLTDRLIDANGSQALTNASKYTAVFQNIRTGTLTGNISDYGMFNNLTINATDDQFAHTTYGNYNNVSLSNGNTTDSMYGVFSQVFNNSSTISPDPAVANTATTSAAFYGINYNNAAGTISSQQGANFASLNNSTGTIINNYGVLGASYQNSTGTITGGYGGYLQAYNNNASGTMTSAYGARTRAFTNATNASIATAYGLYSDVATASATTTGGITTGYAGFFTISSPMNSNAYGVYANVTGVGTGTNYGLYSNVSGSVTNNYALYTNGTAKSYFGGNVGIGTTSPAYKLDISGGTGIVGQFSGRVIGADAVNSNEFATLGQISGGAGQYWQRALGVLAPTNITDDVLVGGTATSSALIRLPGLTNQNAFFNLGTGNVGIGTTAPAYKLDVNASDPVFRVYATTNSRGIMIHPSNGTIESANSTLFLNRNNANNVALTTGGGNVSIGTTSTLGKLLIEGAPIGKALVNLNYTGTDQHIFTASSSGTTRFVIGNNGNVGIGYSTPLETLTLNRDTGNNVIGWKTNGTSQAFIGVSNDIGGVVSGSVVGDLIFRTQGTNMRFTTNSGSSTNMILDSTGNVGIGSISPGAKLDIVGTLRASGITTLSNYTTNGGLLFTNGTGVVAQTGAGTGTQCLLGGTTPTWGACSTGGGITGSGTTNYLAKFTGTGSIGNSLVYDDGTNVGIGTTIPASWAKLDVSGSMRATGQITSDTSLRIRASGTDKVLIHGAGDSYFNGGNVGIGTTTPTGAFNVTGAPVGKALVNFNYTGTDQHIFTASASGTTRFVIGNDGNVGIGTTTPTAKLQVDGSVKLNTMASFNTAGSLEFNRADGVDRPFRIETYNDSAAAGNYMKFQVHNGTVGTTVDVLTLLGSGNVGIGSTAPAYQLDVVSGDAIAARFDGRVIGANAVNNNEFVTLSQLTSGTGQYWTRSGSNLYPSTITDNISIGTSTPVGKFNVEGAPVGQALFNLNYTGTDQHILTASSSGTTRFVIANDGNVGIGSTSPTYKLDVAGTGQFTGALTLGTQATTTTHAVRADRDLIAGSGLTGGGNLTVDRTFNVGAGSCITVAADTVGVTSGCVNATTLDSIDSTQFLRSDTSDQFTAGTLTFNSGTILDINGDLSIADTDIAFDGASTNFAFTGNFSINTDDLFLNKTSGNLGIGTTAPTSRLSLASDGTVANLFDITDSGLTIFQVTQANMISNVPAQFNAAGDVSIAYDLNFTNPTASYIKSSAPLYMTAGEAFNSSDLTLRTFNSGNVIVDSQALSVTGSATISAELTLSSKTTNGGVLYTNGSGLVSQTGAGTSSQCLIGGTSPSWGSCASGGGISGSGTLNYLPKFTPDGATLGNSSIFDNGNIGIGTTVTPQKLTVSGGSIQLDNNTSILSKTSAGTAVNILTYTSGNLTRVGANTEIELGGYVAFRPAGAEVARIISNGNVGIGTTSPDNRLHVYNASLQVGNTNNVVGNRVIIDATGNIEHTYGLNDGSASTNYGRFMLTNNVASEFDSGSNAGGLILRNNAGKWGGVIGDSNTTGGLSFLVGGTSTNQDHDNFSASVAMRITESGNIGIGTTSPIGLLNVGGAPVGKALVNLNYTGTDQHIFTASSSGTTRFVLANDGNVGIGTTAPAAKLNVSTSGTAGIVEALRLGYNNAVNSGSSIGFWAGNTTTETARVEHNLESSTTSSLRFYTYNSGLGERLRITANGNVGIGSTSPTEKLDVVGNITASGDIKANGTYYYGDGKAMFQYSDLWLRINPANAFTSGIYAGTGTFRTDGTLQVGLSGSTLNVTSGGDLNFGSGILFADNAGNVGIGSTSPAAKLDIAGNVNIMGTTKEYFSGQETRTYRNVAQFSIDSPTQTGTLKVVLPTAKANSSTMQVIKISGYDYVDNGGAWEVIIGGYNYATTGNWVNTSAEIRGSAPFTSVRLGSEGSTDVILLGDTTTVWQYPQVFIDTVHAGFSNEDGFEGPWTIAMITSETGITVEKTPTIKTYVASNGNFGIGTTSPSYKLDVQGGTGIVGQFSGRVIGANAVNSNEFVTLSQLTGGTGQYWTLSGNNLYPTTISNNIGIGTSSPSTTLQVNGTNPFTGTSIVSSAIAGTSNVSFVTTDAQGADIGAMLTLGGNRSTAGTNLGVFGGIRGGKQNSTDGDTSGYLGFYTVQSGVAFAERMRITNIGNVGIGSTAPAAKLDVAGTGLFDDLLGITGTNGTTNLIGHQISFSRNSFNYITASDALGALSFRTGGNNDRLTIDSSGNVGIGTTTPTGLLNVTGAPVGKALVNLNYTGTDQHILTASSSGTTRFVIANDGNVGIGTTNPGANLEVGTTTKTSDTLIRALASDGYNAGFEAYGNSQGTGYLYVGQSATYGGGISYNGDGTPAFVTSELSDRVTFFRRDAGTSHAVFQYLYNSNDVSFNGNVGIGSTAPGYKLDVAGTGRFTGAVGINGSLPGAIAGGQATGLAVTGYTGLGGLRINGADVSNTIYQSTGKLAITTGTGDLCLSSGTGCAQLYLANTGNVGIGSTTPAAALDVVGGAAGVDIARFGRSNGAVAHIALHASAGDPTAVFSYNSVNRYALGYDVSNASFNISENNLLGTNDRFVIKSGNIGIGTSTPTSRLSLASDGTVSSLFNITDSGSSLFEVTQSNIIANVPAQFNAAGDVSIAYDLNFTNPTASYIKSNAPLYLTAGKTYNSSDLTLETYNKGNVNINTEALNLTGSATISAELTLSNKTTNNGVLYTNGSGLISQSDAPSSNECLIFNGTSPVWDACSTGGGITGSGTTNYLAKFTGSGSIGNSSIFDNGNVGIGSTTPQALLDIASPTSGPTLRLGRVTGQPSIKSSADWLIMDSNTAAAAINYYVNQHVILVNGGGNVGIGSTAPGTKLDVAGDIRTSSQFLGNASDSITAPSFSWNTDTNMGLYRPAADTLGFVTSGAEQMRLSSTGNLGVGTTTTTYKLNVAGDANFTGNIGIAGGVPMTNRALYSSVSYTTTGYGLFSAVTGTDASVYGSYNSVSAAGTLTANRGYYGSLSSVTNNANDSMFQNLLYGAYNQVQNSNGVAFDTAYGSYNYIQNNDTTLTATTSAATLGYILNNSTGTLTNAYGTQGQVINNTTGTVSNARGLYGYVRNDDGTMTTGVGMYGLVQQLETGGVISSAYGGYFNVAQTAGTITSGYGIYITDVGATTNQYGLYQAGSTDNNYFAGNVGIGSTSPTQKLDVAGGFKLGNNTGTGQIDTSDWDISTTGVLTGISGITTDGGYTQSGTTANTFTGASSFTGSGTALAVTNNASIGNTLHIGNGGQLQLTNNIDVTALNPGVTTSGSQISGPVNAHLLFDLRNNDAGDAIAFRYSGVNSGTVDSIGFVMKGNGNVGIGSTNPTAKLEVVGTLKASGITTLSNYITNGGLLYTNASGDIGQTATGTSGQCLQSAGGGSPTWGSCSTGSITGSGTTNYIAKFTSSGVLGDSSIFDNGNIGIGTTVPGYKLEISSATSADTLRVRSTASSGQARINLMAGTGGLGQIDNAVGDFYLTNAAATGNLILRTNNTEIMRITSSGNVGIGTTAPASKFQVDVANGATALSLIGGTGAVGESVYLNAQLRGRFGYDGVRNAVAIDDKNTSGTTTTKPIVFDTSGLERLRIASNGNIGIGTTGPTAKLQVAGNILTSGTVSTTAGGAAGVGEQTLASASYIQSRGMNLVTNGTGLLGNNYNFSDFTFDSVQTYAGKGSFQKTGNSVSALSDELMPIDPGKSYQMDLWAKSTTYVAGNKAYFGIAPYDVDGNVILAYHHMRQAGTDTTLAQPLAPGDTVVYLTSAANWNNAAGTSTHLRNISVYGHTSASGYTYPDYTYTRRVVSNAYADGGINTTTNTVTLSSPWPSTWGTIPAGTAISNGSNGGNYKYIAAANQEVPNTWTSFTGTISGIDTTGTNRTYNFPPGTAFVKLLFLLNRDVIGNVTNVSTLSFTEVTGRNTNLVDLLYDTDRVGFTIKGATGQTADLFQWKNSANAVLGAFTAAGNLGIGSTSPTQKLDVAGGFKLGNNTGTGQIDTSDWDISTTGVLTGISGITTDGGYTQSGTTQNTFTGNLDANAGIDITSGDLTLGSAGQIDFADEVGDKLYLYQQTYGIGIESGTLTNWSGSAFRWRVGGTSVSTGTERMVLDGSGNLTISGTLTANSVDTTLTLGSVAFAGAGGVLSEDNANFYWDDTNNRLGIGTAAPSHAITVATGSIAVPQMYDYDNTAYYVDLAATGNSLLTAGNAGIGTTSPLVKHHVVKGGVSELWTPDAFDDVALFEGSGSTSIGILSGNTGYGQIAFSDVDDRDVGRIAYGHSNNAMSFYTLDTERITILSNGNVGIGSTSPVQRLQVAGYVRGDTGLCIGTDCRTVWPTSGTGTIDGSGTTNYIPKFTGSTTLGNSTIYDNGNIGIGTTNPQSALEIVSDSGIRLGQYGSWGETYSSASLVIGNNIYVNPADAVNRQVRYRNTHASYGHAYAEFYGGDVVFNAYTGSVTAGAIVSPQERMRIEGSNGNVGIGSTAPSQKLDVDGNIFLSGTVLMNNAQTMQAKDSGGTFRTFLWPRWSDNAMYMNFGTGGLNIRNESSTLRFRIQDDGNVGIGGISTPDRLFTSYFNNANTSTGQFNFRQDGTGDAFGNFSLGAAGVSYSMGIDNSDDKFKIGYSTTGPGGVSSNTRITIATNGNVGIGTTNPTSKLRVEGGFFANGDMHANGTFYVGGTSGTSTWNLKTKANVGALINQCDGTPGGTGFNTFCISSPDGSSEMKIYNDGNVVIAGGLTSSGDPDVAEQLPVNDPSINEGDILSAADPSQLNNSRSYDNVMGTKSSNSNRNAIIGVVSTNPSMLIGQENAMSTDPTKRVINGDRRAMVLAGRIPTKVSTINGPIQAGDLITASDIPGVGMKATTAGTVVGRALQAFTGSNDPHAETIPCPDGTTTGVQCGKIIILLNVSWVNPEVQIAESGNLNITGTDAGSFKAWAGQYKFERKGGFAEAVIAKLVAGITTTQQLVVNGQTQLLGTVKIGTQTLQEYILSVVQNAGLTGGNNVTSPIASIDKVNTDVISPLNKNEVTINGDASVSGTLRAKKIVADEIEGLDAKIATLSAGSLTATQAAIQNITNITNIYQTASGSAQSASDSATIATGSATPATDSASVSSGSATATDSATFTSDPIQTEYMDLASSSAALAYTPTLSSEFATFTKGLMSFGPSTFADAAVTGQLSVNGSLIIAENSINTLGGTLEIQPLAQGDISFMAGLMTLDTEGNLNVAGNAYFAKDVTVKGTLAAHIISPVPSEDLIIRLPSMLADGPNRDSKLVIQNASGSGVLEITNTGDLTASGSGQFANVAAEGFSIIRGAQADISATQTVASSSAGVATINANYTERTIVSEFVREDSLIYLTPVGNTRGIQPYIARQTASDPENGVKGSFTIQIPIRATQDMKINWFIVN